MKKVPVHRNADRRHHQRVRGRREYDRAVPQTRHQPGRRSTSGSPSSAAWRSATSPRCARSRTRIAGSSGSSPIDAPHRRAQDRRRGKLLNACTAASSGAGGSNDARHQRTTACRSFVQPSNVSYESRRPDDRAVAQAARGARCGAAAVWLSSTGRHAAPRGLNRQHQAGPARLPRGESAGPQAGETPRCLRPRKPGPAD